MTMMKNANYKTVSLVSRFAAIAILAGTIVSSPGLADQSPDMMCDYSEYLQEPVPRARFLALQNEMYQASQARSSGDSRYLASASGRVEADEVTKSCLGCHDEMGSMVKNSSAYPKGLHNEGMVKMASSHSIGMDYEGKTLFRSDLKSSAVFPQNMMLVNGKLGCVTCHDPLNPEGNHLATSNSRSGICFVCHNF